MPWWSWVLIWVGAALVLVAVLIAFAVWYWRLAQRIFTETGRLSALLSRLAQQLDGLSRRKPVPDDAIAPDELHRLRAIWASRLGRRRRRADYLPKRRNVAQRGEHARRHAAAHPGPRRPTV
jgi:hypothetical protein